MENITVLEAKPNPAEVYIRSLNSEVSRKTQREALGYVVQKLLGTSDKDLDAFNWSALRYEHTSALQTWLLSEYAPATSRRYIAAVKGTLKAAWRMGQMSSEDYMRAVDLGRIAGHSVAGRMLSPEEVGALLATCTDDYGIRDAAMLMVMVLYTARRSEVTTVQLSDYQPDYKPGIGRLILHGKGNKDRVEFLQNGEKELLEDWLNERGNDVGPLFCQLKEKVLPMSPITVYKMIGRRMKKAGISNATPHDLRRTSISNLLDVTDAVTVAKIAGHSSTATTMLYDKRGESRMIDALAKLHLPFRDKLDTSR